MTPCPQPIKRIIFIDWDDTLLPTSWLKSQGYEVDKPILKPELLNAQIEHVYDKVSALLELYRQYGYVYIITNKYRSTYYIGMTNNLKERLSQHKKNLELGNKTFASKYNLEFLVYYEKFVWVEEAIAREKEIKKWRREKKMDLIRNMNPDFEFLNHHFQ